MTTPTPKFCYHGNAADCCDACDREAIIERLKRDLAAAQSDLASMKADRDAIYNSMRERALAAEARAEQNAKDAERYLWLRGNGAIISRAAGIPVHLAHFGIGLDAAIDAARRKP